MLIHLVKEHMGAEMAAPKRQKWKETPPQTQGSGLFLL